MSHPVRRCPTHGFVAGERCPDCEAPGDVVLDAGRRHRLSKFLSGLLRHFPHDYGVALDDRGWADAADVAAAVLDRYVWADREAVEGVVETDPKGRFERRSGELRAAYGHSVPVDLEARATRVPETLYHGTDPANLSAIRTAGLRPMGRQLVHLSPDVATARAVGARHAADPVVLEVDADELAAAFPVTRRGDVTYTVECVPPAYLCGTVE